MQDVSLLSLMGRLVVSLAVVLVLMAILARLLKGKMGAGGGRTRKGTRQRLEVLGRQVLTRNSSLALLRVDDRTLLVGVTDHSVNLLTEVDSESYEAGEEHWTPLSAPAPVGVGANPTWRETMERLRERTVRRS